MADVDKALPNVEQTINIPSEEDINIELEEQQKDPQAPVDVQTNDHSTWRSPVCVFPCDPPRPLL